MTEETKVPDGNGRMGRLWQTVILGRWNPLFYALPIENMVLCHQLFLNPAYGLPSNQIA